MTGDNPRRTTRRTRVKLSRTLATAFGVAMIGTCAPALAQQVEPMVFSVTPSGSGATHTVRMDNSRSAPITVETAVNVITVDEAGVETWTDANDDFQIFPPQSIIQPGQSQAFRVRYVGDPALSESRSYRFSLRQLPIALAEGESGIAIGLDFNTLLNVVPPSTQSDLVIESLTPDPAGGGWDALIENRGTRYVRLTRTVWTFRSTGGAEVTLPGTEVFVNLSGNLVPPGVRRRITIPRPATVPAGEVTLSVTAPPTE